MWTNQDVSNLLRQYRQMLANVKLIESQILYSGMCSLTESEVKLYLLYHSGLDLIQTWLTLLDKEEQFVVKLHLIDKWTGQRSASSTKNSGHGKMDGLSALSSAYNPTQYPKS